MNTREWVSALADGQLDGDDLDRAIDALAADPEALEAWSAYHLVGDVLRSPDLAATRPAGAFVARFSQRLATEAAPPVAAASVSPALAWAPRAKPANDPVFRWKLAAGFASVAAVASIGWASLGSVMAPTAAQLAAAPAGDNFVMIRDAQLDEMLAAHQQMGGAGPLEMPAAFVRQVTFDPPKR
ncbi:sigma-E factor negative regulatory protein [Ramlibacter aurantiacus]